MVKLKDLEYLHSPIRMHPKDMRKTRTYPRNGSLFAPCPLAKNAIPGYKLSLANACSTRGAPTSEAIAEDKVAAKQPAKIRYPVNDIFAIFYKIMM